jgi:hypothetical protein
MIFGRLVGADVASVALCTLLAVAVDGTVVVRGAHRYTRVWARTAERAWRVVGGYVSAVPDAPHEMMATADVLVPRWVSISDWV